MAVLNIKGTSRTFEEKVAGLEKETAEALKAIQAALNAKKKVNERLSKKYVTYNRGRDQVAKISIIAKSLRVHLALDPKAHPDKTWIKDLSEKSAYAKVPAMVRISSKLALKRVLALIETL
jgi:predicted transport protein